MYIMTIKKKYRCNIPAYYATQILVTPGFKSRDISAFLLLLLKASCSEQVSVSYAHLHVSVHFPLSVKFTEPDLY